VRRWVGILLIAVITMGLIIAGCAKTAIERGKLETNKGQRLKVIASFYPMYEFAKQVGKDKIDVRVLIPAGVEPHDWEPTPKDMAALQEAKVFIYNGAGFEHWVDKVLTNIQNPNLLTVETTQGLELIAALEEEDHAHHQIHQGGTDEEKDPHVWVDPVYAQHQVRLICEALSTADPANRSYYEENAALYISKLEALNTEYKEAIAKARHRSFITSHAAFNYLAKRYNLQQIPISGMAPNAEPSPERLKELIGETKERQLKYVFFETLVNPKVADIVAKEAGIKTLVLNPLEGLTEDDVAAGKDYLILMRENLTNLKLALEVQ